MSPATTHGALYAAQFFAFGVMLPFLPVVLAGQGMEAGWVAAALAAGSVLRVVAAPLLGALADRLAAPRLVLALAAAAAACCAAGYLLPGGVLFALAVTLAMHAAMAPVVPLTDAMTLAAASRGRLDYGPVRAWGSVSFIVASLLAGLAVERFGPVAAVLLMAAGLAATAAAALAVAPGPAVPAGPRGAAALLAPLRLRVVRRLLAVSALVQGSHAFYYAFGTLHWQAAGLPAGTIGLLWAVGVVAEILLFLRGRWLVDRLGPVGLCVVAAAAGVLRWGATAFTTDPWLLAPLQALHALSFAAQHLASMTLLARAVPPGQAGTAQALHSAVTGGLATGALMLASGPLFTGFGGLGFLAMAALCAAAVPAGLALGRAVRRGGG